MAAPFPPNPLLRPTENPATRFGGIAPPVGPRIPVNALARPLPVAPIVPPQPAVPTAPVAPVAPGIPLPVARAIAIRARHPLSKFQPSPVAEEERISTRVPVPKADFPEEEHKDLHEKTMGETFDDPGAHAFVRDLYSILRKSRPHIHPRTLLESIRDAHYAVQHGFMTPEQAGQGIGHMAHQRHMLQTMQTPQSTEESGSEPEAPER